VTTAVNSVAPPALGPCDGAAATAGPPPFRCGPPAPPAPPSGRWKGRHAADAAACPDADAGAAADQLAARRGRSTAGPLAQPARRASAAGFVAVAAGPPVTRRRSTPPSRSAAGAAGGGVPCGSLNRLRRRRRRARLAEAAPCAVQPAFDHVPCGKRRPGGATSAIIPHFSCQQN
jgi:hypothetical protein